MLYFIRINCNRNNCDVSIDINLEKVSKYKMKGDKI